MREVVFLFVAGVQFRFLVEGKEETQEEPVFVCPSVCSILSEACKHVDFSPALTMLAHGAGGVNELVCDREKEKTEEEEEVHFQPAHICPLPRAGIKSF